MLQIKKEKEENILKRKIFGRWRRRRTGRLKEENIWRRKTFCQWRRRRTEKEKEENIFEKKNDDRQNFLL